MFKSFAAALAVTLFAAAQPATAQVMRFTEEEASALARFAMPRAFAGLQQRCRATLADDAYMFASSGRVQAKLENAARGSWPRARSVVLRIASDGNQQMGALLGQVPPESLQPFVDEYVSGLVSSKVPVEQCGQVDRVLELLDPLPAENLASLAGLFVVEAQRAQATASDRR